MIHKDNHQVDKTTRKTVTNSTDSKETKDVDLSILSLESLLKLFCGIDI